MAIFTAIATAIFGGATLFGASLATIAASGLAFAAQLGFQYLNRPKKRKYTAIQGETQYGGDVPVGTLLGIGKTKGQRSFYAKWGKGNKENGEVFLLANGWCDGLEPYVYFYGQKHTLTPTVFPGNHVMAYEVENFGGNILILFFDGRPGQQVESRLVGLTAGLGQTWKETSVNAGQAYVVVYRTYDANYFSQGKPEFEFVLRGLREYDPRKDSTVAGGSGPQRINDPATWTHTLNPAVHRLNYQLGLRAMVSGRTLIGEGKSLGQLDLGSYFVAMNVCDSLRTDGKRTYQCSLFVTGDDDHTEILKEFDDAMAGYGLNRRGLSGVIAGAPQIPVLEITADDLPIDRAKEVQFRKSAFDRYNHLSGQFLSIEANWNPESLTPVHVNADVAADGRNRQTSNDFLQVTDPDIAQYLLNIRYRQNRRGGTATLPVSRRVGLMVQEGEWVLWRGKEWMISEWVLDEQFRVTLKLSETGADIYDDEDIEPGPVVIPPAPVINPSMLSTVQDFNVEAGMISSTGGQDAPCLRFTWSPPADPTITEVRIPYRKHGETLELLATCSEPESGEFFTSNGVVSETLYNARATITTVPDRLRTYTPWVTTVAPTGRMNVLDNSIVASKIATAAVIADKIQIGAVTSLKLADQAVTTAKIQIAAVTQDILANNSVISAKIADAAIGITKFASGIEPVGIIAGAVVPALKTTEVITVDGKLYRWNGTAYVSSVASVDLTGQITSTQITDGAITTPKILAGAVVTASLATNSVTSDEIVANSIIAGKIAAGAVAAAEIAAGAITADKLAVGTGSQWLENTDFYAGMTGWGIRAQSSALQYAAPIIRTDTYGVKPYGALQIYCNTGYVLNQYMDITPFNADGSIKFFTVAVGKRYQFSCYSTAHRATRRLIIGWADSAGVILSYTFGPLVNPETINPQSLLSNYTRTNMFGVAPANAASAMVFVRHNGTVSPEPDSYVWFTRAFFGEATDNQTEPSPWSQSGVTLIDAGNIVTGAVTTAKLDVGKDCSRCDCRRQDCSWHDRCQRHCSRDHHWRKDCSRHNWRQSHCSQLYHS
ncbi:phage tail protein [Pararhizobium sp. PWRC1-1]|uniref:phage tail protein n=1 Tax=Pararhizobium sp. PWRC1-1 TaxID=2804566 RepID=UPI003CEF03DA